MEEEKPKMKKVKEGISGREPWSVNTTERLSELFSLLPGSL